MHSRTLDVSVTAVTDSCLRHESLGKRRAAEPIVVADDEQHQRGRTPFSHRIKPGRKTRECRGRARSRRQKGRAVFFSRAFWRRGWSKTGESCMPQGTLWYIYSVLIDVLQLRTGGKQNQVNEMGVAGGESRKVPAGGRGTNIHSSKVWRIKGR